MFSVDDLFLHNLLGLVNQKVQEVISGWSVGIRKLSRLVLGNLWASESSLGRHLALRKARVAELVET